MNPDVLIIGGGAIGLSLAYELSGRGTRVQVVDRGLPGQESSWAGAGIIPAAGSGPFPHPYDQLTSLSHALHGRWSSQLLEETGIDNGFRRCGGLYLARRHAEAEHLAAVARQWSAQGLKVELLSSQELAEHEPQLAPPLGALRVPDESQLRNPRHVRALAVACERRGVTISPGVEVGDFITSGTRITGVRTADEVLSAGQVVICGGAWSRLIAARLGVSIAVKPIRGQIVLLDRGSMPLRHVVNEGPRYLVPREDGRLLVGSTEEDVGFEKQNTSEGVRGLLDFAIELVPGLSTARIERTWSGLRPGTADGLPYLGQTPGIDNLYVAAGHFRAGLTLSCITAVVISRLMRGEPPEVDLSPFRVDRT